MSGKYKNLFFSSNFKKQILFGKFGFIRRFGFSLGAKLVQWSKCDAHASVRNFLW